MKFTICVTKAEYWQEIHDLLCGESSCSHIPDRVVSCTDDKLHSPTRGTFDLTADEADDLRNHEYIKWVELCPTCNADAYPPPVHFSSRFKGEVKIYRELDSLGPPASNPTSAELNRVGWSVKRVGIKTNGDFWTGNGNFAAKYGDVSYSLTGKNVDVVIHDSGVLQYHPEFMDANGQSRVRDIVLDGPYHIDPDYFITNGYTYTKDDGRTGVTTTSAIDWWENNASRSAEFSSVGTVQISSVYTAARSMGYRLDGANSLIDGHGTACAGLAAGNNMGAAFEANIWNVPGIGDNVFMGIEANYDLIKIFHKYKPVNTETNIKNPTIVNGSWGYIAGFDSADGNITYKFRGTTGEFSAGAATTDAVTAMKNYLYGADYEWSTSSRSSSTDTAANEMMAEGVIYVAAAGNNNQRLGIGSMDPDRLNYMEDVFFGTTDPRPEFPAGTVPCNHRDWLNPQGIGFDETVDPEFHPVVCVGALDDYVGLSNGLLFERKANYSNNGSGIDVWAPADETLAPGTNGVSGYTDYQRYDDNRFYDCYFNGTSAAAPVVTGVIALYLQSYPTATSRQVHNWLKRIATIDVGEMLWNQQGGDDDTSLSYWTAYYNMRGARKGIIFNPFDNDDRASINGVEFSGDGFSFTHS
jgi:subtilisin family serine protease